MPAQWRKLRKSSSGIVGSVANIIVAEKGRSVGGIGFWEYFRVGFPLALATTGFGFGWVLLLR